MERVVRHLTFARTFAAACLLVLLWGWHAPLSRMITPKSGLGYELGIIGGSLMLLLIVYPLRKRSEALRFLGSIPFWFKAHMLLGVVGPMLILFHATFSLGATNSNVALVCMLLVSGSGVVGRYVYSRVYDEMLGRQATVAEVRQSADRICEQSVASGVLPELLAEVQKVEAWVIQPARSAIGQWLHPFVVGVRAIRARSRVRKLVRANVAKLAAESRPVAAQRERLTFNLQRYAVGRLEAQRRVAEFQFYARIFSIWHVFHVPLFFMLIIAGVVHVVSVNIY